MTGRPKGRFRVGAMRERIDIQSSTDDDTSGQTVRSWSNLHATVPAQYIPASGTEGTAGDRVEASEVVAFITHYKSDYSPEQRVVFKTNNYGIVRVEDVEGRIRYSKLYCKRVVA